MSSGALPDHLLRSYSRFTLQPRAELWGRYSTYAAAKANLSAQELHLEDWEAGKAFPRNA